MVRVFCRKSLPRVVFYLEFLTEAIPCALFLSEIEDYVRDATEVMRQIGGEPTNELTKDETEPTKTEQKGQNRNEDRKKRS